SNFNDTIHLGKKRYILMGALNNVYYSSFGLCAFNKDMLEIIDKDANLYEVYNSGNWTYETMYQYMYNASSEANGDGERKAGDDYFGLASHNNILQQFLTSGGETITVRGANGSPTYAGIDQPFINAWEFIVNKLTDPNCAVIPGITAGYNEYSSNGGTYNTVFNEGRALFLIENAHALSKSNTSDIDYGIIGYPKADTEAPYASPVYFGVSGLCVLSNNANIERTGTILENLCAYSYGTVDTAYMEGVLYYKYSKDPESVETMKNIFSTGTVDLAYIYEWADINHVLNNAFKTRDKDVVSLFKGIESTLKSEIQKSVIFYARS
ncbi:MAG: hypothetical protein IKJ00_00800, partial [Clostridia bacterium]|nr:hypothetical protein [Clostridia bacterium]